MGMKGDRLWGWLAGNVDPKALLRLNSLTNPLFYRLLKPQERQNIRVILKLDEDFTIMITRFKIITPI
jgi:hypothetical protein